VLILASCGPKPPDDTASYVQRMAAARAAKDQAFRSGSDSPIPPDKRDTFLPLAYFPIDPEYRVAAALSPITDRTIVQMPTSTGTMRAMRRVGTLSFTLKGQPLKLTAFVEAAAKDLDRLFVPFADMATGTETYAAGRYLDLDRNDSGLYFIDFNKAYQPYCYFNATYECPYPPPENRLKIPVRAGEKMKERL